MRGNGLNHCGGGLFFDLELVQVLVIALDLVLGRSLPHALEYGG
jgi:hypothetical protein